MDYTRIIELKELQYNKDKKHDLNKQEQAEYSDEIKKALIEDGITSENAYYIISMYPYGGINGFISWYKTLNNDDQVIAIEALTLNTRLDGQGTRAFRILLQLLASIISLSIHNHNVIAHLLLLLVDYSVTKNGKRIGDLGKSFRVSFMKCLSPYATLPIFARYPFPEGYLMELIGLFEEALNDAPVKGDKELEIRDKLRSWIMKNKNIAISFIEKESSSHKADDISQSYGNAEQGIEEAAEDKKEHNTDNTLNTANTHNIEDSPGTGKKELELNSEVARSLIKIAQVVEGYENRINQMQDDIKDKSTQIKSLNMKLSLEKEENIKANATITELKENLEKQSNELQIVNKMKQELEDRISRQSSVLQVYQEDKISSQSEQLNSIASSLTMYYKDFLRTQSMDLNTELEMILMDLIEDIFKKLEKNGVDVKGRIQ